MAIAGCKERDEWDKKNASDRPADASMKVRFHIWTPGEILAHDFGTDEWTVESLIPKQGMAALSGMGAQLDVASEA